MRRIEKYKNMEIANKRLLKEQWYNPATYAKQALGWWFDIQKEFLDIQVEVLKEKIEEDVLKREISEEESKEIIRLFQEEGMNGVNEYIEELVSDVSDQYDQVEDKIRDISTKVEDEVDDDWD